MANLQTRKKQTYSASTNTGGKNLITRYNPTAVYGWQAQNTSAYNLISDYYERINRGDWISPEEREQYKNAINEYTLSGNKLRDVSKFYGTTYTDEDERSWQNSLSSLNKGYEDINKFYGQFADADQYNSWNTYGNWQRWNDEVMSADRDAYTNYIQVGKNVSNPTWREANKFNQQKVNNMVTFAQANVGRDFAAAAEDLLGLSFNEHADEVQLINSVMTGTEKDRYNYYIGIGDTESAQAYLDYLMPQLENRYWGDFYDFVNDKPVLEPLTNFTSGVLSGVQGIGNFVSGIVGGGEGISPSGIQNVSGQMMANNTGFEKFVNEGIYSVGNMMPSMAIGGAVGEITLGLGASVPMAQMFGQLGGSIYTGMSSAGNSYVEMLGQGYGVDEARKYGLMVGAAEGALQYAIGGIESIGGRLTNHLVKNAIDGIDNGVARFVANTVINMGSEALEEGIQTALEPVFKSIATGEKYEPAKWSDITYSALLGAVTAGVLEGVPRAIETGIGIRQAGKQYGADASGIVTEALNVNPNSKVAQNAQTRIDAGKGVTGTQIYSMLQNIEQGYSKQATTTIKGAVESKLTELGETKNVSKIATAITKQIMGEDLSLTEKNLINKNTNANQVLNEDINTLVQNHKAKQTPTTQATQTASTQSKSGGVVVDTAEGKTTINKVNEDSTVELANGKTVNASDVKIADTNADLVFKTATERIGQTYTNESATAMIKGYESSGVMSAPEFIKAWDEAYNLGKNNNPISQLSVMPNAQTLSETVRTDAYNIGKALANENPAPQRVEGRVTIDKSVDKKSMTADDKAFVKGLDVIAKAFGVNVELYASPVVDGKRQGEQGSYDAKTRTLRVDLYSGNIKTNLNEKLGLYTASHELTHHIKSVAPDSFNKYADALVSALYEGGYNVDELVARQVEKLKSNGRDANLSESELYDRAFEEMVADASERMLADSDAMERLAKEIKSKDKTLWDKIKSYIKKVIDKLKSIYKDLNPQSPEAALIKDMQGKYEELLQIWSDAAVEASRVGGLVEDGAELGIEIDAETESIAPTMFSERTWTESEYVVNRDAMAKKIAEALDISVNKAKKYIDDVNSIARMIANDRARLDYEASSFGSAFVSNVEYGGSFDYTTLCKKRRIYTGTFTEIQKVLKDTALSADDILKIRNMLIEEGIEATCGLCYVEGSRANMGKFAKKFIELYKRDNPDAWVPNMADVNTPDGVEKMRINHPEVYEQYEYFWNHYGKLKDSDPALFASQQKPKLYEARKEYKGEILQQFKNDSTITKKNKNGGIRMQSFSDFEIVHLIDTMQVIMDMSTVGLAGQAYTKVPEFALAFGDTGLKINLSLIAKGVDENGNLIFDDREGMPHQTAFDLRNKYSKNVGTIIVTFTDEQLMSAMADDRIDFIIPFHRSQWKKGQYGAMGLPKGTKDYTYMQNEKLIKQTYHEYQGRMVKDKATNYMPNEYWDFSKSGKENAEAYLQMCAENNKRPKFYKLLDYDGEGTYSLKEDGSTDGYWKLLVDFKMYDNDGNGSPQMPVTPNFNMEESTKMLNEYEGGHAQYPVAHGVVDRFVKEYNSSNTIKHSDRTSDDVSFTTRSLLADALESTAQNEAEKEKLAEYKGRIDMLNAEEKKLAQLKSELKELTFGKGAKDPARAKALREEIVKTENRINLHDKKLLQLESTKSLKDVLEREKSKAYKRAAEKGREALNKNRISRKESQARVKIKELKHKFEKMVERPTERQYVPHGLVSAMIDVCNMIDTSTDLYKKDGSINKAQQARNETQQRLEKLRAEYAKIKKNSDAMIAQEYDEQIAEYLDDIRGKYEGRNIADMTLEDLTNLYDIMRSIDETLREARKLIGTTNAQNVYDVGDAIIAGQQAINAKRKDGKRSTAQKIDDANTNQSLSPMRAVLKMAGYDESSPLYQTFREIELGERAKHKFVMDATKAFDKLTTGDNAKTYEDAIYNAHGEELVDKRGRKFNVTKMQKMQAVMSYERELENSKLKHVSKGGFSFADIKLLNKGKLKDAVSAENAHTVNFGAELAQKFKQELEKDAWAKAYMDEARHFFDEIAKEAINDVNMKLKHRIVATGKAYIPYEVDQNHIVREITAENDVQQVISSYGMLKDLKDNASQPIIITGLNNILDRHIEQVGTIHGLAIPIRNFNKVWNVKSSDGSTNVQEMIDLNWGSGGKKLITQAVKDVQGPRINTQSDMFKTIKGNYIAGQFIFNGSVVTKQVGSLFASTSMLEWRDPASMMVNLAYTMANYDTIAAEVDKYTASAWLRRQGLSDAELYTLKTHAKKSKLGRLTSKLPTALNPAKWIEGMDSAVALSLWKYAKEDVAKRTGLTGEELLKETAKFYDDVISSTQSMTDSLHRPEIQKGDKFQNELLGMFKTDLYQGAGQIRKALGEYNAEKTKDNRKALGKAILASTSSVLWGSLMTSVWALIRYKVNPYRDDEDDELTVQSWLEVSGADIVSEMFGYAIPLLGGEVSGSILSLIQGDSVDDLDSISLTAVNEFIDAIEAVAKRLNGETPTVKDYINLLTKAGTILGIPANNVKRLIEAINLHAQDIANGEFLSFEAGLTKPNAQRLYNAYLEGDEDKIEKASRHYEDQEAIESTLRSKFRENDSRVQEIIMLEMTGDYAGSRKIESEIINEGHFDKDKVISKGIDAEFQYVKSKLKEAYEYNKDGKPEKADEIYKKLIERGYTQDFIDKVKNKYR